jgi:hypothetical protein
MRIKSWSPYLVGAGIGVLSWFAFISAEHPLGITTAFEHTAAMAETGAIGPDAINSYLSENNPRIGWEWMLVIGVFVGSTVSSFWSGDRERIIVPSLWQVRFGDHAIFRLCLAFLGGMVMLFGARLAQGCTSGHGISGALQLAVSSWIFAATLFIAGIGVAFLIYGKQGRQHV